ncbi:MAG TPA: hypothetical protein VGL00_11700 [Terracidiphilus sp.]
MKITIQGLDYSASLDAIHPLTVERRLNKPTLCQFWLSLPTRGTLAPPARNQAVAVTGDDGTPYFTGYIAYTPIPEYAGRAMEGPRYRLAVRAISDELLLDQMPAAAMNGASGMTAAQLMKSLVTHTRSAALATQALSVQAPVSSFAAAPGATWSESAGQIACQARAAYRAQDGALQLEQIPSAVHPLNESDGVLNLAALSFTSPAARELANDVTVCGEHEPVAYVTEYFLGDGITAQFSLGAPVYFPPASSAAMIDELFNQPAIDAAVWDSGGSGFLSLGAGGLAMTGGSGIDGQTMLTWIDSIELGGTLLVEASGVRLATGSSGMLSGLYMGSDTISGCLAGFQVKAQPGTGAVTVQPIIEGAPSGVAYSTNPANLYTLRIRLHCSECERALATYRSFGDAGAITDGGQASDAPAKLLFEIQECVNGVVGMAVTLYDGSVNSLPPACSLVAASLITMFGSIRAFRVANQGTGWVVSTPEGGGSFTRRMGSPAQSGECTVDRTGRLLFNAGFIPMAGERIAVSYRTLGRAVGRAVNAGSQQTLAASGLPPVAQWIGSVTNPPARSSADCRNAAATLVAASAGVSALCSGSYRCTNAGLASDLWPGDALLLNVCSLDLNVQVVVRTVKLSYASTYPDSLEYDISFANDLADDLAVKTSNSVPADAWLPAPVSPLVLPNLRDVTVTSLNGTTVTINTGVPAPPGGGFEIRRRDFAFMPGEDVDLVMRGSQPIMTFSRETAGDRFYIRMFDGSTPPNYSEFSTALFINLPVSSGQ